MSSEGGTPSSSHSSSPEPVVCKDGVDQVALGQVHPHDGALGTLPERFGEHGFVGDFERVR
jgi:hypothetical protein